MCRSGKRFWPIRPSCLSNRGPAIAAALRFRPSGLVVQRESVEQVYRAAGGQMLAKMCRVPPDRVCKPAADARLACGIPPRSCQHGLQPDPVPARNVAARVPTVLRHRVCLLRGRTSRNWPGGFVCPRCCASAHCMLFSIGRPVFQCHACRRQTSLTAGTLFGSTKLPLTTRLLAIYFISQAKTRLSALELKRHIGVTYPTAWPMHHKIMMAMAAREAQHRLSGAVQVDRCVSWWRACRRQARSQRGEQGPFRRSRFAR